MTCEQALEAMSAALDGELSAEERKELDEHLNTCPECAALMEELSGQSLLLRQLDCDVPAGLDARILSALPEQPRPAAKKGKITHWRRWSTLAACLILALWGGSALTNSLRMGSTGADAAPNSMAAQPDADAPSGDTGEAPDDSLMAYSGGSADPDEGAGDSVGGQDPLIESNAATKYGTESVAPALENDVLYLRVQWSEGLDAPAAQLVSDVDALAALADSLGIDSDALAAYGDEFFEEHRLIAVTLTESSGSVSYAVNGLEPTEDGWQVDILRSVPEVSTCDMAAWLILVETDLNVTDGDVLTVSIISE